MTPIPKLSFHLFGGGPLFELQKILHLTRPDRHDVGRSIALAVSVTWIPLVLLDVAWGAGRQDDSVLKDVAVHVRFLVALPLMLLAPGAGHGRLQLVVEHFLSAGLIRPPEWDRFLENVRSTLSWRDSHWAELTTIALAYACATLIAATVVADWPASWRTVGPDGARSLSPAGWWLTLVSQPIYLFLVFRFLYRLVLWWRFLRQTSRLDLQIRAAHPDGAGGLAFLELSLPPFALPIFAIAATIAGGLADLVLRTGVSIMEYKLLVLAFVGFAVLLFIAPLLTFVGVMTTARWLSKLRYANLSGRQLAAFEEKWLCEDAPNEARLLEMPDSSSVSDFNAMVASVQAMRTVPFGKDGILLLAVAAVLPFVPVVAIEIPLREIAVQILKLLS